MKPKLTTESIKLNAAKVEETPDYWIVPDTVLTRDGVMNGARKSKEELARTWMTFQNTLFTHDHPGMEEFGLVIDLRRIGGWVDNVRFNDQTGDVVGDVYLCKASQPGFAVTETNIARNKDLVTRLNKGEQAEVSIGFFSTDEYLASPGDYNGMPYDRIQREIIANHLASVPFGACSWEQGCGLGRGQGDAAFCQNHRAMHDARLQTDKETHTMCNDQEKKQILDRLMAAEQRADAAEKANKATADALAVLQTKTKSADDARIAGKREDLAKLTGTKAEALPAMDEVALDFTIARELKYRGRTDTTRHTHRDGAEGQAEVVDGIAATPHGFTVVDTKAAVKSLKVGAN